MIIFLSKVHRWTRLKAKGEQAPWNRNSPFSVINYITSTFLSITRSRRFPTRSVPFQREKEKEEKGREKRNLRKDAYFYRVTRIPPAWKKMEERERRGPLSFERLFKEMIARNANDRFLAASKNCATKFALFNPRQTIEFCPTQINRRPFSCRFVRIDLWIFIIELSSFRILRWTIPFSSLRTIWRFNERFVDGSLVRPLRSCLLDG